MKISKIELFDHRSAAGEQDDHHGGVDGFSGPAEPVHCYAPIRAEQAAEHRTSALGQGGKNLSLSQYHFPFPLGEPTGREQ